MASGQASPLLRQLALVATHTTHDPCKFLCKDDSCLPSLTLVCDGHFHCADGGDEADCPLTPSSTPVGQGIATADYYLSAVQILIIVISVLFAVGIITCVLSHYKMGARSWSDQRSRPQPSTRQQQQQSPCPQQQYTYSLTLTTGSLMYTPATVQERQRLEAGAQHDHLVQLHSVQTDLALDLPHSIPLPDGEERPYGSAKHLKLRDAEQHREITRNFIRPPPNRTVPEVDCIPPYRSNSIGLMQKSLIQPLTPATESAPLVMRSHSMSSNSAQVCRQVHLKGQQNPVSSPNNSSHLWIPPLLASRQAATNSSTSSGTSTNSNRTFSCSKTVTDSKYDSTDPPPPYSNVVNQWDINTVNRQQNNGV